MELKKLINNSKLFLNKDNDEFKKSELKLLQELIETHSDLYYNKQEPVISDREYDTLFKKLEFLEGKFEVKNKKSLNVWADFVESTFKKVAHSRPMISLDNTYNEEDLKDFNLRVIKNINTSNYKNKNIALKYTIEFKFDGLWVELIYKAGELVQAITRGDWVEWEDVTENIMQIDNIPKRIDYKEHLEVRWEVVMPISSFEELNKQAKLDLTKIFSNPRNAASWSLRMKDNRVTKQRKLKFFAYDLANFEEFRIKEDKETYFDVIKDLEKLSFDISSYFEVCDSIDDVIYRIQNFWDTKQKLDFEIDWLVIKVNNIELWKTIGFTQHHPKYAISYKFPAEILTTKILSVDHQVWRTGTITPVANLEAINIGWAIIRRATLHNYEEVENLWVRVWDIVFIKRAWEVIPKIISVVQNWERNNLEEIYPPKFCPSCETEVIKDEDKVRYYCSNDIDCPAKNHEKLTFAVGKQGFDIDWLWERQIEIFLKEGIIHNLVDIFKISEKSEDILLLEWFKEKSVENLISWIEKAKKVDISTFLTALWISWVGKKTAKTLSKLFLSKFDLINFNSKEEILENLEDIWPEIANNVVNYFKVESHLRILTELVEILNISYYKENELSSDLFFSWKKMCITWSFDNYNRDDLIEILEKNGWEFVNSVSKKLDYLLAWDKAWSKLKKASELWISIISVEEFISML